MLPYFLFTGDDGVLSRRKVHNFMFVHSFGVWLKTGGRLKNRFFLCQFSCFVLFLVLMLLFMYMCVSH